MYENAVMLKIRRIFLLSFLRKRDVPANDLVGCHWDRGRASGGTGCSGCAYGSHFNIRRGADLHFSGL